MTKPLTRSDLEATSAADFWRKAIKAQGEGTNPAGGFLVPAEVAAEIISLRNRVSVIRNAATVYPMSSDSLMVPRRDTSASGAFVGENAQISVSELSFDNVDLVAKKAACLVKSSSELEEDAVAFAGWIASELGFALADMEDSACIAGDGTSTYGHITGLTTKIVGTAGAITAATNNDTPAEITATDLSNVVAACPDYAMGDAVWLCSQTMAANIFYRLAGSNGGIGPGPSFWGFPIVTSNHCPSGAATDDFSGAPMLFFGSIRLACTFGDRRGINVKRTESRYLEYDQPRGARRRVSIAFGIAATPRPPAPSWHCSENERQ
jgi:HK97 family phage major capsid protein